MAISRPPRAYLNPAIDRGPVRIGFAAAAILAFVFAGAYLSGHAEVFSPGRVSSSHAPFGDQCVVCHAPRAGVEARRCERCHDRAADARLGAAAHAAPARAHGLAKQTPSIDCAGCHGDHRGRTFDMRRAPDAGCASCHTFGSMAAHPELAVKRAGVAAAEGLKFSHQRHVADRRITACETCHEATPDLRGFAPMSFDRTCARCHLTNGVLPGGLRHRETRVLDTLRRLAAEIDPDGDRTMRAGLRTELTRIEQDLATGLADPPAARTPDDLEMVLRHDVAEIDRRLAEASPSSAAVEVDAGFLRQQRERRERQLAQVSLERELSRTGRPLAGPSLVVPSFVRPALEARADAIRSQLSQGTADAAGPKTALSDAQSLAKPCLVCHEMSGARIAPVRAAQPTLTSARFTHAPHVIQTGCVTCHASAATSTLAADVNLPAIQTCRSCHDGERARATCVTCHRYHDLSPGHVSPVDALKSVH